MNKTTLSIEIAVLLENSTVGQLTSNTDVFFGNSRKQKSNQVNLSNVEYVPAVQDGILIVKAQARGEKHYNLVMQFDKVRYAKPGTQWAVPVPVEGQELYIMPLKQMGNYVQVHCDCLDFYWRFANYNAKNKSLLGEPPAPYVKKTDRVPLNPDQVPGACKHLRKLSDQLHREGLLK